MYPTPSGFTSAGSCVTLAFARAHFVRGLVLLSMRHRHHRRETLARDKHPDGVKDATAGRPAPRLRGCYRGVRAQASTTTLPASLGLALRSRLRFGAVPAK